MKWVYNDGGRFAAGTNITLMTAFAVLSALSPNALIEKSSGR